MKIAVVVNPVTAEEQRAELQPFLDDHEHRWIETDEDDPGTGQAREAVDWGAELVIACGGDGTVRACAEGLIDTGIPLAIVPAGTGNLLARNFDIPDSVPKAFQVAINGDQKTIDTGVVGGEAFLVMAGVGLDAEVMAETDRESKDRLGSLAYVIEGAKHLTDEPFSATVRTADRSEDGEWVTVLVGNLGELQAGVNLFPEASPTDGKLDLLAIPGGSALEEITAAVGAVVQDDSDAVMRAQGPEFEVALESPTRYELDGEPREAVDELSFRVKPGSLRLMTPGEDSLTMTVASYVPEVQNPESDALRQATQRTPIGQLMKEAFIRFRYADGFSFARSMAFQVVLTIFPGLIFAVALATRIGEGRFQALIREGMNSVAPGPASELLIQAFQQGSDAGRGNLIAIALGGLAALVSGVAGMAQLQRGASRIYGVLEDRPTMRRYGLATVLTLTVGLLLTAALLVIVVGSSVEGAFRDEFNDIWVWLRWPLGVGFAVAALAALFRVAPNREQPGLSWLLLGGGVAVAGWLLVSIGLAIYLNASASFGETYGPLGGLIGTMLWAQLSSIAIFYGLAVAAQLESRYEGIMAPTAEVSPTAVTKGR